MSISSRWHRHPGVRSGEQLTLGERAADAMRNRMDDRQPQPDLLVAGSPSS